jgi:V/A-type H+/Na+-transporting ATPase subunit E
MNDKKQSFDSAASGVEQLISRLKNQGVAEGEQQAATILSDAERRSTEILGSARAEAEALLKEARSESKRLIASGEQALRLAARDTTLRLQERMLQRLKRMTRHLVGAELVNADFLRALVVEVAGRARDESGIDEVDNIGVAISAKVLEVENGSRERALTELAAQIMAATMRKGVTITELVSEENGIRIRLKENDLEVDLTEHAIAEVLLQHLQPRFRTLMNELSLDD